MGAITAVSPGIASSVPATKLRSVEDSPPGVVGVVEDAPAVLVGEAHVDVARVAGPLVAGLRHERRHELLLRGQLLHRGLEEERVVRRLERRAMAQRDLELAGPGLGVARLHGQAVGEHVLPDEAADRLLPRAHRDAVRAGPLGQRHEVGGAARQQRSGRLAQEVELELQRAARLEAHRPARARRRGAGSRAARSGSARRPVRASRTA